MKQKSAAAQREEEGEEVSEDRRYSKTEESVAFSIRRPSLPQTVESRDSPSASLTIGSAADADDAISREGEEVQVSLGNQKEEKVNQKTGKWWPHLSGQRRN